MGPEDACEERQGEQVCLDQQQYTDQILEEFGMQDSNPVATPEAGPPLSRAMSPTTQEERDWMQNIPYDRAVGQLNYLACGTRPDIAQAVNEVSRFLANPGPLHWVAVKRIFRYLRNPCEGIRYDGSMGLGFETYCDANFAGDVDKRRSRTGYFTALEEG